MYTYLKALAVRAVAVRAAASSSRAVAVRAVAVRAIDFTILILFTLHNTTLSTLHYSPTLQPT